MISTYMALAIFALATLAIAINGRPRDESDFLIKGRNVGPIAMAAATFTLLGGGEFITLTGLSYTFGFWSILYFVGIAVGFFVLAGITGRIRENASSRDLHSLPDYFYLHFGRAAALLCTLIVCLALGALLQIQFIVGSEILAALTGSPTIIWVIGMAAVVGLYLYLSGFKGVLSTDAIQAAMMFFALVILSATLKLGDQVPVHLSKPPPASIPLGDGISLVVLGIFAICGGADVWQRVYSAQSDAAARKGLYINAAAWLIFGSIFVWLSLLITHRMPDANPNTAFVEFITKGMPSSVGPMVGLLILSAVMSTADVEVFVLAVMINKELVRNKNGRASEKTTKLGIMVVVTMSAALAVFLRDLVSIYFTILYLLSIVGPIALAKSLGRGNSITAIVGMLVGLVVAFIMMYTDNMSGWAQLAIITPSLPAFLVPGHQISSQKVPDQEKDVQKQDPHKTFDPRPPVTMESSRASSREKVKL
jgi:Na+/proline symporter